jgi:hypothetical protein
MRLSEKSITKEGCGGQMSNIFRGNSQTILDWFRIKGYGNGDINACLRRCMHAKLGATPAGGPADLLHLRLGQLGYTGGLQDRLNRFFMVKTGATNPNDAERLFFQNTALDFT